MKNIKGELLLFLTAIIWGTSFVSQKLGMNYVEPFTFGAARFLLGALILIPVILYFDNKNNEYNNDSNDKNNKFLKKDLFVGGTICGVSLFFGASLQQIGMIYTTAGKAGFITALYIVLVPLFGLLTNKKINKLTWIGVALATIGLYFLCVNENFTIQKGDVIVLAGTLFWAIQIIAVDSYASKVSSLKLSFLQFMVAGFLSLICAFLFETPNLKTLVDCAGPILYTAIMVVGVAYTLQILGQKTTPPAIASIIMSMESLFAAISGAIFLNEVMNLREYFGCILMFAAVIITQLKTEENHSLKES
ncbi:DMT family transporter [Tissierella sp. Yu-01]|uniref:DMT family transporter n=1 Tax=Tissierella sp. Yu-01 TaxID=3035694 RepID=UPI00240E21FA|nr:DMT family transporter [Tissierella sp. Yu-01]WFA09916.1 DMT family transporter [Tissierella sp. Yu-01]